MRNVVAMAVIAALFDAAAVLAQSTGRLAPRSDVVQQDSYDSSFVVAAMGSIAGGGGFFRSAFVVCNGRAVPQPIDVYWYPQGGGAQANPVDTFTIPASRCNTYDDFVASELKRSGLGAARFVAVFSGTHTQDTGAVIEGFSRIWTQQAGTGGTFSQSFPSVSETNLDSNGPAEIFGMRQDTQYRCNIGIVNLSATARDYAVHIYGGQAETDFTVTVPPNALIQTPLPAGIWGVANLYITPQGFGGQWAAYGSSVDNITTDAWSNKAERW